MGNGVPLLTASHWRMLKNCFVSISLAVSFCVVASSARTEVSPLPPTEILAFSISAQPLASAIQAFSQASGVEVFYESSIVAGRKSSGIDGQYSREAALKALLGRADLTIRFTRPNAVVLSDPNARVGHPSRRTNSFDLSLDAIRVTAGVERGGERQLREFGNTVQNEVETVLRKNNRIRSGNYRIRVKLWIDPSRTIRRAELAQSTGDRERDTAITDVLKGFVISQVPPPNTPQPIRVIVAVRSL
jgi:hypothetical protein